jgi:long-chain acyl-CoA synthetase
MHPGVHAAARPDAVAVVRGRSGDELTYRELKQRSNRLAHLLRSRGMRPWRRMPRRRDHRCRCRHQ